MRGAVQALLSVPTIPRPPSLFLSPGVQLHPDPGAQMFSPAPVPHFPLGQVHSSHLPSSPPGCIPPPHPAPPQGSGLTKEPWVGPTGRMGRTEFALGATAAGKGGAECVAAARLMPGSGRYLLGSAVGRAACPLDHRMLAIPALSLWWSAQAPGYKSQKSCHWLRWLPPAGGFSPLTEANLGKQ